MTTFPRIRNHIGSVRCSKSAYVVQGAAKLNNNGHQQGQEFDRKGFGASRVPASLVLRM